jgi:uncharacterized membrane protein
MEVVMTIAMRAVVVALILPSLSLPAKAGFDVCNKTKEKVDVAVAYVNRAGGFISEGWFTFAPCESCSQLVNSSQTSDPHNYFYYAKTPQGAVWSGNSTFCIRSGQFKFKDAQNCVSGERKGFIHVTAPNGNFRQTLTSKSSSCGGLD